MKNPRLNLPIFILALVLGSSLGLTISSAQDCVAGSYDQCCSSSDGCCDFWSQPQLSGDWLGLRPAMADSGILLNADVTQFYQGVASGGLRQQFLYGGHGDYVFKFDFDKLSGQEGLFLQVRAEHRFGQAIGLNDTGAYAASAILANLPTPATEDLILSNVLVTQALSEQFVVFMGKMDTLDGDMNAFAHGRGKSQFLNTHFVFNPIAVQTIPYATLGAGFSVLQDFQPIFTFTVLNATDTTTTSGFNELFADGVALAAELRLPTNFLDRPGHQGIGATWNSREYIAIGQDPRVLFPGYPIDPKDGSWSLRYNFDQYLVVDRCDPTRGWGVFGRAGLSDGNPNPLSWNASFGVGGNSPLQGRQADRFGIGWYYSAANQGTFFRPDDSTGVELFYNIAVTPWFELTPDLQVLDGGSMRNADTAVLFGLRGNLIF